MMDLVCDLLVHCHKSSNTVSLSSSPSMGGVRKLTNSSMANRVVFQSSHFLLELTVYLPQQTKRGYAKSVSSASTHNIVTKDIWQVLNMLHLQIYDMETVHPVTWVQHSTGYPLTCQLKSGQVHGGRIWVVKWWLCWWGMYIIATYIRLQGYTHVYCNLPFEKLPNIRTMLLRKGVLSSKTSVSGNIIARMKKVMMSMVSVSILAHPVLWLV